MRNMRCWVQQEPSSCVLNTSVTWQRVQQCKTEARRPLNEMRIKCMAVLPILKSIHAGSISYCEMTRHCSLNWYLMVYSNVPSSFSLRSLLGVVMLWAMDFLPLRKKVSGVQMLLASRLFRGSISIGPLKHKRSSFQLWRKNTSMVYSCSKENVHLVCTRRQGLREEPQALWWGGGAH